MFQLQFNLRWLALGLLVILQGCGTSPPPIKPIPTTNAAAVSGEMKSAATTPTQLATAAAAESANADKPIELRELNWDQLQELVVSHKGHVVVVDIWSTACEPCLHEFPRLVALQKRHADDVVCISFDCDFDGRKNRPVAYYRERVMKALTGLQANHLINVMCTVAADELFQKIDLDSIPAVYVYDRTGKLAKRFDNRTPASATDEGISYETQIDPLVAELVKAEKN